MAETKRIAILHGAGYVGGELIRLLLAHPYCKLEAVTSRTFAGRPLWHAHPALRGPDRAEVRRRRRAGALGAGRRADRRRARPGCPCCATPARRRLPGRHHRSERRLSLPGSRHLPGVVRVRSPRARAARSVRLRAARNPGPLCGRHAPGGQPGLLRHGTGAGALAAEPAPGGRHRRRHGADRRLGVRYPSEGHHPLPRARRQRPRLQGAGPSAPARGAAGGRPRPAHRVRAGLGSVDARHLGHGARGPARRCRRRRGSPLV